MWLRPPGERLASKVFECEYFFRLVLPVRMPTCEQMRRQIEEPQKKAVSSFLQILALISRAGCIFSHGWGSRPRERQQNMEVCIQSYNDPTALARKVDNLRIARSG